MHQPTPDDEIRAAFYAGYSLALATPGASPRFTVDELDELAQHTATILARRTAVAA